MNKLKLLLRVVLIILLALAGFAMLQDRLLYFPTKATTAELVADGLRAWPSSGDFRGLLAEPPQGASRGTVIVFHGNAGHSGHRGYYAKALVPLGMRVILAEYPGYGPRQGALGEASLVADAQDTIARASALYGTPLIVIGESLGAGVAAAASTRQRDRVSGLLLITPWDSLAHVAAHYYPWLPMSLLLRDRYDSVANLARFGHPVMVAIAENDTTVPARFGKALHDALDSPKRLAIIQGGEHNDWILLVDEKWWRDAVEFLLPPAG